MDIVADEGIDRQIVETLRSKGHSVFYVKEEMPGVIDEEVLQTANEKGCILITQDKDFGELVFRTKLLHQGIILIRLSGLKPIEKANLVATTIETYQTEIINVFVVINKNQVKIRK